MTRDRAWPVVAVAGLVVASAGLAATPASDTAGEIAFLLGVASPDTVARVRGSCASGNEPANAVLMRQAGVTDLPDMVDGCVAALTRLARDGTLGFVRDARVSATTPALSLDTGFVTAFRKHDTASDALPTMAALKPSARRCLAQEERDTGVCYAVGYAYGARTANGETVAAP